MPDNHIVVDGEFPNTKNTGKTGLGGFSGCKEYEVDADAQQHQVGQRPEVQLKGGATVEAPVDEHSGQKQNDTVQKQHAPVRERALREVRVNYLADRQHYGK